MKHFWLFPLALTALVGCDKQLTNFVSIRSGLNGTGTLPVSSPLSVGVTGSSDAVSDSVLKGSLEPTFTWTPISDASQYKVAVVDSDGATIRCPEVTTSFLTYAFSSCSLPDKGAYKLKITPFSDGLWQNALDLISFTVDGLNLAPRQQEILTGEALQLTPENGTGPYVFGDGGAGYINASSGLLSIPLSAPAATLNLTIADAASSTNSTSLKVRSFSDAPGFPTFAPQQGDLTYPEWIFQTASGTLLASLWADPLPWMGHSTTYRSN